MGPRPMYSPLHPPMVTDSPFMILMLCNAWKFFTMALENLSLSFAKKVLQRLIIMVAGLASIYERKGVKNNGTDKTS